MYPRKSCWHAPLVGVVLGGLAGCAGGEPPAPLDRPRDAGTITPPAVPTDADGTASLRDAGSAPLGETSDLDGGRPGAGDPDAGELPEAGAPVDASAAHADATVDGDLPNAPERAACEAVITPVPDAVRRELNLDPFYQKYVDADGLAVLGSAAPDDAALLAACELVNDMLAEREDVRDALIRSQARFAIIGRDEGTAEIPEYGYRDRPQADIDYINRRARGLGGQVASCGEENILCLPGDRYRNESICVHEFAHTISVYGAYRADRSFESRLREAFDNANRSGLYENTYALENLQEYWAEGVQNWYDTNDQAIPANGVHNEIDTREELETYDPVLYALVDELLPEATTFDDCHRP